MGAWGVQGLRGSGARGCGGARSEGEGRGRCGGRGGCGDCGVSGDCGKDAVRCMLDAAKAVLAGENSLRSLLMKTAPLGAGESRTKARWVGKPRLRKEGAGGR